MKNKQVQFLNIHALLNIKMIKIIENVNIQKHSIIKVLTSSPDFIDSIRNLNLEDCVGDFFKKLDVKDMKKEKYLENLISCHFHVDKEDDYERNRYLVVLYLFQKKLKEERKY